MSRYVNIPPSFESALDPEIRPLEHSEIPLLDAHLDPNRLAGRHHERFAQQQYGHLTYRIAWLDDIPVGHTMVRWTGATDTFIAERITACVHIEDFFVMPQYRSHGIGTQILVHAERIAAERGFTRIGLAVGIDNTRARALYERNGYTDSGFGTFQIGGSYQDVHGKKRQWRETCEYLVKNIS